MNNYFKKCFVDQGVIVTAAVVFFALLASSTQVMSAEVKPVEVKENKTRKPQAFVIESQVKGSQEQPNIIYIMPWKTYDKAIEVKEKKRILNFPDFRPVNPSDFKEQVRFFSRKQTSLKSSVTKTIPISVDR